MFKIYLLEKHAAEISPAKEVNGFERGYYGPRRRKLCIRTNEHLKEAYLKESLNYVTFWLDPFPSSTPKGKAILGKRGSADDDELICLDFRPTGNKKTKTEVKKEGDSRFNSYLSKLRQTEHGSKMADFKIKCWARMLVNGSHDDETVPPNVSFFATEPKGVVKSSTSTSTCSTSAQPSKREMDATGVNEAQIKARGLILG
ncbi:uncharacterized protein LOC116306695 [Actinia tenebrosa]|uniref:Uncharacterized protein LOC116306695 n=1 Tax=Actinia tenebrosa TaxID=6105 RepID=A0A6P8J588_ACTTE|nr:uncharacterized protein LOC116306695 [Actinia tenebrosa]